MMVMVPLLTQAGGARRLSAENRRLQEQVGADDHFDARSLDCGLVPFHHDDMEHVDV
jgi:hypothetical protein